MRAPRANDADVLDYASPGRTRAARPPRPPVVPIVLFGLILFPLIIFVFYPVANALPFGWTTWVVFHLPVDDGKPGVRPEVEGWASGRGQGASVKMTTAGAGLWTEAGEPFAITVDLTRMTYFATQPRSLPSAPLTRA